MFEQPIVERRNTSPLATSLLVLSAICLLGATVFVGAQIQGLTVGTSTPTESASAWQKSAADKTDREIKAVLGKEVEGEEEGR